MSDQNHDENADGKKKEKQSFFDVFLNVLQGFLLGLFIGGGGSK